MDLQELDIEIGSNEYNDYIIEQLIYGTDEKLKQHPQYSLLHAYMAEYKIANENKAFEQSSNLKKTGLRDDLYDSFYMEDTFCNKTIGQIKAENELYDAEISQAATSEKTDAILAARASYSGSAAASYARQYALSYNSNYPNYSLSGGDCTNFVSQCIYAGGIRMIGTTTSPGTYESTSNWYCKPIEVWHGNSSSIEYGVTTSWMRARDLKSFLWGTLGKSTATIYSASNLVSNCKVGDVVQLVSLETGNTYHSIIITTKTSSTAKFCGHSSNSLDKDVSQIDWTANKVMRYSM